MPWQEISSIAVTKRMGPGNLSPAINASSGSSTPTTNTTVPPPSSSSMPQIRSLAWHPTGRYLAASGLNFNDDNNNSNNNGTLVEAGAVVWNSITWERVSFRLDPTESENRSTISSSSLDWSPDGKHLVVSQRMFTFLNDATAADNDATTTLTESATLETCSQCRLPKWSPDGRYIATAFGNQVYILNGAQALAVQQNKNTSNNKSVVLMAQGASLYNVTTVPTYMMIGAMAWSPNSNYLAVGGAGNAYVYLWDTSNWDAMPTTVETTDGYGIDSLSWSPGGHSFAVGTGRVIEIWHMEANTTPEAIPSYAPVPNTPWETFTPTSSPILGIIESTVVPSSSSSAESTTSQAFSVATMTGIAVIAIVISVASAVVLFGWRLRVVVQNDHGNSKAKHRKKRHGEVPSHKIGMVTFSDSEDKTGDTVDEEHLDRVISFSYLSPINGS